jgi:hypothetical protein
MKIRSLFTALCAVCLMGVGYAQDSDEPIATATPVEATATGQPTLADSPATPSVRPLSVTVQLLSKTEITGTLLETTSLAMRTSFGVANIPLSEVAGIRTANSGDPVTTVVMHNGDSVTGATELSLVAVETDWGKAEIKGDSIASLLFAPGLQWMSKADLNGNRWVLVSNASGVPRPDGFPQSSGVGSPIPTRVVSPSSPSSPSYPGRTIINGQIIQN